MAVSPSILGRAPAKTILSGEHAVVYGQPALALALARYAQVVISRLDCDAVEPCADGHCELVLSDLNRRYSLELSQLGRFRERCQQRYQRFINDQLPIEAVLPDAADLYRYALALFVADSSTVTTRLSGCRIELHSEIAIGAGMGSSAATVSALLTALAEFSHTPLTTTQLVELTTRCEMLQHGRSSGLDPAICASGGLAQFQQGQISPLPFELDRHWYLVDSGRPSCSTGSCTSRVRQQFADSDIWPKFGTVTDELAAALNQQSPPHIIGAVRANHRLLVQIGVVPAPVQRFIDAVERHGGAAKISGAGAVSGESGGLILVYYTGDPKTFFNPLLESLDYSWQPMELDPHGAQIRD